jgi:hypothetical protein
METREEMLPVEDRKRRETPGYGRGEKKDRWNFSRTYAQF